MSKASKEFKLINTIFKMLNYANMYIIILDEKMEVKFMNQSLASDLGFESYEDGLGRCWLDFIVDNERKTILTIHKMVSEGMNYEKYREFQNKIKTIDDRIIDVLWFNCNINTGYNWTFSFGIRKEPITEVTIDSLRDYYRDVIDKDRTMINAMRDMIVSKQKLMDSCEPSNLI